MTRRRDDVVVEQPAEDPLERALAIADELLAAGRETEAADLVGEHVVRALDDRLRARLELEGRPLPANLRRPL